MLSGSSPIFALSNHTTCSQTQTGATVPLNLILTVKYASEKPFPILLIIPKASSPKAKILLKVASIYICGQVFQGRLGV